MSSTTSYASVGHGRSSWHLCSPEGDDRPDVRGDNALAQAPAIPQRVRTTGPLLDRLGDLLRLSALLDEPELRVLLDQHLHIRCDMLGRDHEAVISRPGLLPVLWRELELRTAVERWRSPVPRCCCRSPAARLRRRSPSLSSGAVGRARTRPRRDSSSCPRDSVSSAGRRPLRTV